MNSPSETPPNVTASPATVTPFPAQAGTGLARGGTRKARTGTGRGDAARTAELNATLPKGIAIGQWYDGRAKPFYVRYGSKRAVESFAKEGDRNKRAEDILRVREEQGLVSMAFDPKEWRAYTEFRQRTGANLAAIEQAWHGRSVAKGGGMTVPELIALYKEKRKTAGRSLDAIKHRDLALARFAEYTAGVAVPVPTDETVVAWLAWLPEKYGLGDVAVAGHFSALRAMFNLPAVKKVCRENPCDFVEAPEVDEKDEVSTLSLRQAFEFFKANRREPCIGRLAVEAFAGLRFSSASKLRLADLDFDELGITLPASRHKSGRRHYVDGFPRNLWLWLRFAYREHWLMSPRNYMRQKSEAFIRAGFRNPGNVLRHTFPTMHLSAFKNAAATATLLQHRNATMLYQRYKGRGVSQAVARAYFLITPTTVKLPFDRFCRLVGIPVQP
jgi:integrase